MAFNPEKEYEVFPTSIPIEEFTKYTDEFVTRPPYQRKNVWSTKKKQALLDSLFRRYYVPKIVVREVRLEKDKTVREIIDGQQRIITAQEFLRDELKLPKSLEDIHPELPGSFYSNLNVDFRRFIDREIKYEADIVKGIEDPYNPDHQRIATEIFWRLQQGEDLNFMEKSHARLSSLARNFIVKYSDDITFDYERYIPIDENKEKHKFFQIISRDNGRMQHLSLLARILMLEEENGPTDLKDQFVVEYIERYMRDDGVGDYSFENLPHARNTISNLNALVDVFEGDILVEQDESMRELSTEYVIISTYLLVRHLRKYYVFDDSEKKLFYNFFMAFYKRWKEKAEDDIDIQVFANKRQQDVANIEIRDRILRQLFFEYAKESNHEIITKDDRRAFSEYDRIRIYRRDDGLCQMCLAEGKPEREAKVSWSDFEADHVLPHSKGGETVLENGQVLCSYHNKMKSNKLL